MPAILSFLESQQEANNHHRVFHLLLGLCVESLAVTGHTPGSSAGELLYRRGSEVIRSHRQPAPKPTSTHATMMKTLRQLFSASFLTTEFLSPVVFMELMDVFERLSTSDNWELQAEVARTLCKLVEQFKKELIDDSTVADVDG